MSNQKRYIQVFEHETIQTYLKPDGKYLTPQQFDQLCAYNDLHGNKYFTVVRQGVKFKQYVGVIQIGRTTIEILPKTDDNDSQFWHKILLQMLAECKKIKRESVSQAVLRKRENSLLDLYIDMYLDEVEALAYKGLAKKYLRDQNHTKALKGKLIFSGHIRKNLVHKERFFTEHTIYSSDNIYNQIVKLGLEVISKLSCATQLKDRAMGLSLFFHSVSSVRVLNDKTFDRLVLSRNTEKYKEVISIARLIILNYSPDIKSGSENLLAILFNMNDLWQEYILLQLKKNTPQGATVYKGSQPFFKNRPINPDIVIQYGQEPDVSYQILDTKWKVIDQAKPSAEDLKQMFAYNIHWKNTNSVLLYPKTNKSPDDEFGKFYKGMENGHGCTVAFIELVTQKAELDRNIGEKIMSKVLLSESLK
ncbi:MAG: hypothetical protein RIA69_14395 [Cyclobacteriaceae bacterium]